MEIFVLGIIFGLVIQPILDGLVSIILSFFELIKSSIALRISKANQQMRKLSEEEMEEPRTILGFTAPVEEEGIEIDL